MVPALPVADIAFLRHLWSTLGDYEIPAEELANIETGLKRIVSSAQPITDHDANNASAVSQTASLLSPLAEDARIDLAPLTASNARLERAVSRMESARAAELRAQPHRFNYLRSPRPFGIGEADPSLVRDDSL